MAAEATGGHGCGGAGSRGRGRGVLSAPSAHRSHVPCCGPAVCPQVDFSGYRNVSKWLADIKAYPTVAALYKACAEGRVP